MAKSLGIFVTSNQHLQKIIKLCEGAKKRGVETTIFFTHLGTQLTQDARFRKLQGLAKMAVCNVAFESHGFKPPIPGISNKDFTSQARHAEIIEECDRYLVF